MNIITSVSEMRAAARKLTAEGKSIALVPTMGALHEGHLSLVRAAKKKSVVTVVSIFVNPTQFGPGEDFTAYPRNTSRDSTLLEKERVDILFTPEEMYPPGYKTYVEVENLEDKLCGCTRPGHFRGVCTVVLKLFEIVRPDLAFFGRKDAQQAIILLRMCRDLNLDVRIELMPIVREPDGLAMSSRNSYLKPEERRAALILFRSLEEARKMIARGENRPEIVLARIKAMIAGEPLARLDYVEAVETDALAPVTKIAEGTLVALAVYIGRTRLIDNVLVGADP